MSDRTWRFIHGLPLPLGLMTSSERRSKAATSIVPMAIEPITAPPSWPPRELVPTAGRSRRFGPTSMRGSCFAAAERLGISPRTVKAHLSDLCTRLGVQTNAQAVHELWLGYLEPLSALDGAEG